MSKKSISKNYLYNLFYQILVIVLPLITTPYLARVLGAEAIGIYSYTLSIASYFILFGSFGVAMYGQREIAYLQDNKKERTIKFWEILLLRCITMAISLILFGVLYCSSGQYSVYYRILIIEILSQAIDISWFFQGIEEFKKTVLRNSIVKLIFCVSVFLFIKSQSDLLKYILIIVLADFLGNFSLWLYLPKFMEKIKIKELNILKHLKPIIGLFIPQIAIQIYTVLDRTMIGKICSDISEVGFYEQAQKVIRLLLTIVTSLGTVMIPRMANTLAKRDMMKFKEYMKKSYGFMSFLAFPIIVGIILISKEFVPIFFGEGYNEVVGLIQIISPIVFIIGISNLIGYQYLIPARMQKMYTISVTAGAVINFLLNLIFIRKLGAFGASIATVISELVVSGIQLYSAKDVINIKDMAKISRNNIISSVIMFIVIFAISKVIYITGIISIGINVIIGVIIYVGVLVILKDKYLEYLKDKLFGFLKDKFFRKKKKNVEE